MHINLQAKFLRSGGHEPLAIEKLFCSSPDCFSTESARKKSAMGEPFAPAWVVPEKGEAASPAVAFHPCRSIAASGGSGTTPKDDIKRLRAHIMTKPAFAGWEINARECVPASAPTTKYFTMTHQLNVDGSAHLTLPVGVTNEEWFASVLAALQPGALGDTRVVGPWTLYDNVSSSANQPDFAWVTSFPDTIADPAVVPDGLLAELTSSSMHHTYRLHGLAIAFDAPKLLGEKPCINVEVKYYDAAYDWALSFRYDDKSSATTYEFPPLSLHLNIHFDAMPGSIVPGAVPVATLSPADALDALATAVTITTAGSAAIIKSVIEDLRFDTLQQLQGWRFYPKGTPYEKRLEVCRDFAAGTCLMPCGHMTHYKFPSKVFSHPVLVCNGAFTKVIAQLTGYTVRPCTKKRCADAHVGYHAAFLMALLKKPASPKKFTGWRHRGFTAAAAAGAAAPGSS